MTALHSAAYHNGADQVRALIASGADPNAPGLGGSTPLHLAAQQFSLDAATALLELGAAVDPVNDDGQSPLHIAVSFSGSRREMIALLRSHGGDAFYEDFSGRSPVALANMFADRFAVHCFDDLTTAQDLYRVLIRDHVSPTFRSLGLKGSSGKYSLPVSTPGWALVAMEKWKYSSRAEVRFRINLFTVSQAAWSASSYGQGGKTPSGVGGGGYYGVETHWACLSHQVVAESWWTMTPITDVASLGREIGSAMEAHGLPWLLDRTAEW
jgi:hypothetical protein